jgi:hypothetical protein
VILSEVQATRFKELYMSGANNVQLSFEFDLSVANIKEAVRSLGLPPRRRRDVPTDLEDTIRELGVDRAFRHYKCSKSTLARWVKETGIGDKVRQFGIDRQRKPLVIPADWHDIAPTMSIRQLSTHYRTSRARILSMIEQTGVTTKPSARQIAEDRRARGEIVPKKAAPRGNGGGLRRWFKPGRQSVGHPFSDVERAANHLRRFSPNVFRCDILMFENKKVTWGHEHGVPDGGRRHYFVSGHGVIPTEQMVELARSKGFA